MQCAAANWHLRALLPLYSEEGQGTDYKPFNDIAAHHTLIASYNVLLSERFKNGPLSLLVYGFQECTSFITLIQCGPYQLDMLCLDSLVYNY